MKEHPDSREPMNFNRHNGGFFKTPDSLVTDLTIDLISEINELKTTSMAALSDLHLARLEWQFSQERGSRQSYGDELEKYVINPQEYDKALKQDILLIESLKNSSNLYDDACSVIRRNASEVIASISQGVEVGSTIKVNNNTYGIEVGPFGWSYFMTFSDEGSPDVVYDSVDNFEQDVRHADMNDYVGLLVDVLSHNWHEQ